MSIESHENEPIAVQPVSAEAEINTEEKPILDADLTVDQESRVDTKEPSLEDSIAITKEEGMESAAVEERTDSETKEPSEVAKVTEGEVVPESSIQATEMSPKKQVETKDNEKSEEFTPRKSGRIRHPVQRYLSPIENKQPQPQPFAKGFGTAFGDIPNVSAVLEAGKEEDPFLKALHRILFPKTETHSNILEDLRGFTGITFANKEQKDSFASRFERWTLAFLKELCGFLHIEEAGLKKADIVQKVVDFMELPSALPKPQIEDVEEMSSKKRNLSDDEAPKSIKKSKAETSKSGKKGKVTPKKPDEGIESPIKKKEGSLTEILVAAKDSTVEEPSAGMDVEMTNANDAVELKTNDDTIKAPSEEEVEKCIQELLKDESVKESPSQVYSKVSEVFKTDLKAMKSFIEEKVKTMISVSEA